MKSSDLFTRAIANEGKRIKSLFRMERKVMNGCTFILSMTHSATSGRKSCRLRQSLDLIKRKKSARSSIALRFFR